MNNTAHKSLISLYFLIGILVTVLIAYIGFNYYRAPIEERFFIEQHNTLKPSGVWGHAFGIIGSLMMIVGVAVYMVRKRFRRLHKFGFLKHWLEFHIFLCIVGPILILYHTAFKFGGIVAVSFWSMVVVVLSGIAGRFIYVQIPRSITGQELSIKELDLVNQDINGKLQNVDKSMLQKINAAASPERYKNIPLSSSLSLMMNDLFIRRSIIKELQTSLNTNGYNHAEKQEIISAARNKLIITRKIGLLRTTQKAFRYWHIAHLPFAMAMFIIMVIHIVVTIVMGYKWIF